jgi:hypothetical protein
LDITSEFVLPAGSGNTVLNDSYYVDDLIPEADLSDPHLGKALNEKWAHRTLLALADKELRNGDTDRTIIVGYLNAAKHIAATEEEKREIEEMISIIRTQQ